MMAFSGTGAYRGVHIGTARGKIALWLDRDEALALASILGSDDRGADELYEAVDVAYPPREEVCDARYIRSTTERVGFSDTNRGGGTPCTC